MTNKQYLEKLLNGLNVTSDDVDVLLLKAGLDAAADVDTGACDLAVYNRMSVVLKATMQNVQEGGYSVSWNMEAVRIFYRSLCVELGKEDVLSAKPKVRDRSNVW